MSIVDEFIELKNNTDADLLAMQVGDFYEFFDQDAITASQELGLKVSKKSSHGSSYPMAGVPIDDIDDYVEKLVDQKGYTVAIADQYKEDGNHKRSVSRIVTPGTLLKKTGDTRYLSAIVIGEDQSGIAFTDISSGEIVAKELELDDVIDEISIYDPAETIVSLLKYDKSDRNMITSELESYSNSVVVQDDKIVEKKILKDIFRSKFGQEATKSLGISGSELAISAVGRILKYLDKTKTNVHNSITNVREIRDDKYVSIDAKTRHSLEISDTMGYESGDSLFDIMDHTVTTLGRKRLKMYLQRPLVSRDEILKRQKSVSKFVKAAYFRKSVRNQLEAFPNISRISSKATYGTATPNQIMEIADSVDQLDELKNIFEESSDLEDTPIYGELQELEFRELENIKNMIRSSINEEAGNSVDIGTIKKGFNDNLDQIIEKYNENQEWLRELENDIEEKYEISHISVDRNQTDGYYIQVGKSETSSIPDHMTEIKRLKNSVRYKTDGIRDRENEIVRLEEKRQKVEKEVFDEILEDISENSKLLQSVSETISHIDAIQSLSKHSVENGWVKPDIKYRGDDIDIKKGRHPSVEQNIEFTPNDVKLNENRQFIIVTGANMSGKSTYLRQTALICLLAQIGCYVPCDKASLGILDAIFARIGSVDEISRGRSTFMVEMSELANILHSSTDDSLVILDEVGRGTSTYDGISIAKSTVEYLSQKNGNPNPKTLFATHYHQLNSLAKNIESVHNVHLPIKSTDEGQKFTHKVVRGSASKSYGIHVASMAGLPEDVVEKSREHLEKLKEQESEQD